MDRRTFTKIALGAAGVGAAAAAGGAAYLALRPEPESPTTARYVGARITAGPAARGVPYLPLALDDAGALLVDPARALLDVMPALLSCGHEDAPGLRDDHTGDERIRYFMAKEKLDAVNPWYRDRLGEPVRPEDFPSDDFGAAFAWRSEGAEGPDVITGVVVRLAGNALRHEKSPAPMMGGPVYPLWDTEFAEFRSRYAVERDGSLYLAMSSACPHFCCVMSWKESEKLTRARDAWDQLYCLCHSVACEPREPVVYPLPS